MKAGDLRHRILLQRPETIPDDKGNRKTLWITYATVYASMADVSGRDFFAAQSYQAQDIVTFGIRWRNDLNVSHRIATVRDGQDYRIEQINRLGYKGDFMHIKARLVQGVGV